MREIKFRAWVKKYKDLCYPKRLNDLESSFPSEDKYVIIMQYTGLKDKNGKEIYEGDILKLYLDNYYFKVEYDIYNGFQAKDGDGGTLPTFNYNKAEIIGNIYENPELLK